MNLTTQEDALREWALKCQQADYRHRHGPGMDTIKQALDALPMFELIAAAGGLLPEAVKALPQYSRLSRGLGDAHSRSVLLAGDLLAERERDLSSWIDANWPEGQDADWLPEPECPGCHVDAPGPEGLCAACAATGDPMDYAPEWMREECLGE